MDGAAHFQVATCYYFRFNGTHIGEGRRRFSSANAYLESRITTKVQCKINKKKKKQECCPLR